MELITKTQLRKRLNISISTLDRKLKDGTLPGPVCGVFPRARCTRPRAEEQALWDADACLKAWGRPV